MRYKVLYILILYFAAVGIIFSIPSPSEYKNSAHCIVEFQISVVIILILLIYKISKILISRKKLPHENLFISLLIIVLLLYNLSLFIFKPL